MELRDRETGEFHGIEEARITGIIYSTKTVNLCTSQAIRFPNVALHLPVQINSETDVFRSVDN